MSIHHNNYFELLKNNRLWASEKLRSDPDYFGELSKPQQPKFLFIGCSDSRVPLNVVTGSEPGDMFVHRNIANQVNLTDINLLSVIEFAVEILKVEHIIVCGHYKCGGVKAAIEGLSEEDIVENWISPISDMYHSHKNDFEKIAGTQAMYDRLSEMNVILQLKNVLRTPIMQRSFRKGKHIAVHGWIFDVNNGLIKELPMPIEKWKEFDLLPADYQIITNNNFAP